MRVTIEGALPFEARLDLVGKQVAVVRAHLARLTQAGRLRIAEHDGRELDVVIDGAVVGRTPWEGALLPGGHTVLLRGPGMLGRQPTRVNVVVEQLASLDLVAENLGAAIRVEPKPTSASVIIDGVPVGSGVWDGRLRLGAHHVVVRLDGYLPETRAVSLASGARRVLTVALVRDPALLGPTLRPGIALELDAGPSLGLLFGGEVADNCTGDCSARIPVGVHGLLHASYQFRSGFGLGVHAGYFLLTQAVTGRAETIRPVGKPLSVGTVDDRLRLGGLAAGGEALFRIGTEWPLTLRFGAGALLGAMTDGRTGSFSDSKKRAYTLDAQQTAGATYLYVAPEIRLGKRIDEHFEINVGLEILAMTAVTKPQWDETQTVLAGADGLGTFRSESLSANLVLAVIPGVGARYEF